MYATVLGEHRMCLCGMLAAESATLPEPMREALKRFFELNERWLAAVLVRGRRKGQVSFAGAPIDAARMLVGALEGAMMLAHSLADAARFKAAAARLLADFAPARAPAQRGAAKPAALSAPRPSSRPTPTSASSGTFNCATPAISRGTSVARPVELGRRAPRTPVRRAPA